LVSVVADQHPKIIFWKKIINPNLSLPAQIHASRKEAAIGHAEREEEPSAITVGQGRRLPSAT
jgi:hypothetical protein